MKFRLCFQLEFLLYTYYFFNICKLDSDAFFASFIRKKISSRSGRYSIDGAIYRMYTCNYSSFLSTICALKGCVLHSLRHVVSVHFLLALSALVVGIQIN